MVPEVQKIQNASLEYRNWLPSINSHTLVNTRQPNLNQSGQ